MSAFPDAVAFDTLEEAISDVVTMQEILLTTECVFLTLPCTDEAALRDLNGYAATRTARLFTDTQFEFVLEFRPAIVMYEMTPSKGDTHTPHHDVISRFEEPGYSTDTALIDASMVGDHTSHLRWFAVAVLDGPNIKGRLTPDLPYWPLPVVPWLDGNAASHGYLTLSPSFTFVGASGVRTPRAASPCVIGIGFPSHGQGPATAHNGSNGRVPSHWLCAVVLCAFAGARCPSLTLGIPISVVGDEVRLVHGADTPENVFL